LAGRHWPLEYPANHRTAAAAPGLFSVPQLAAPFDGPKKQVALGPVNALRVATLRSVVLRTARSAAIVSFVAASGWPYGELCIGKVGLTMKARMTGKVLLTENKKFGSGDREFRFKLAHVQTGVATIEEIRFTDSYELDVPRAGDVVDLEVEIGAFAGRSGVSITAQASKPFDESFVLEMATV
jgi:hypothetical protein